MLKLPTMHLDGAMGDRLRLAKWMLLSLGLFASCKPRADIATERLYRTDASSEDSTGHRGDANERDAGRGGGARGADDVATLGDECPSPAPPRCGALPIPPIDAAESLEGLVHLAACSCLDERVAWVGAFESVPNTQDARAVIWRTTDGGARWSRSELGEGEPAYTWAIGPSMSLTIQSAASAEVRVTDVPQHHNGHRKTEAWFRSSDGGKSWRHERSKTTCLDPALSCGAG